MSTITALFALFLERNKHQNLLRLRVPLRPYHVWDRYGFVLVKPLQMLLLLAAWVGCIEFRVGGVMLSFEVFKCSNCLLPIYILRLCDFIVIKVL